MQRAENTYRTDWPGRLEYCRLLHPPEQQSPNPAAPSARNGSPTTFQRRFNHSGPYL